MMAISFFPPRDCRRCWSGRRWSIPPSRPAAPSPGESGNRAKPICCARIPSRCSSTAPRPRRRCRRTTVRFPSRLPLTKMAAIAACPSRPRRKRRKRDAAARSSAPGRERGQMSRRDALRHVAFLLGIATAHVDALGVWHEVDDETLSRLIAAFGLPEDPQQAAASLDEERNALPFGLAPVHIVDQDDPDPVLPLPLSPQGAVEWHLRREDGGELRGRAETGALHLPGGLPLGYHRLALDASGTQTEIDLIVAPRSCYLPEGLRPGARSWGVTAQVYALRGARDWGIGDFSDLKEL